MCVGGGELYINLDIHQKSTMVTTCDEIEVIMVSSKASSGNQSTSVEAHDHWLDATIGWLCILLC